MRNLIALVLSLAVLPMALAQALSASALPQGGAVVAGQAAIQQSGNTMLVQQGTQQAIINWQQFNIGSAATVQFQQPASNSVALNRVIGADASQIQGQLQANGQVFLLNSNGILFGQNAQVNVGGMVASTLNLSDNNFLNANYLFTRDGATGQVRNEGNISAARGGAIALLAPDIHNSGTISAQQGSVVLAAGEAVTLSLNGGPVQVQVDPAQVRTQISNSNLVQAEGGTVVMTAKAANALLGASINNSGVVRASALSSQGGEIRLVASTGHVDGGGAYVANSGGIQADGTVGGQVRLDAGQLDNFGSVSAQGTLGRGGSVQIDATRMVMTRDASIDASGRSNGGSINVSTSQAAGGGGYWSGQLLANGQQGGGGQVQITGRDLNLFGGRIDARGATGGGQVNVGGGYQGNDPTIANAQTLNVNATHTDVSATQDGTGGQAVFWSEGTTLFSGVVDARGASQGAKATATGGVVEVSSRGDLGFGGTVQAKQLLLDPKTLNIIEPGMGFEITNFVDPDAASTGFGTAVYDVSNTNLLVLSPNQSAVGSGAGYVFQRDGTLVSALRDTGGVANWRVLGSDKYLITNTGANSGVGAVSYFNAASSTVNGRMDATNSLVGDTYFGKAFGQLYDLGGGYYGATVRTDLTGLDSFILQRGAWHFFKADAAGTNLATGTLSASNSLVGTTAGTAPATDPNPGSNSNTWSASTRGDSIGFFASDDLRNSTNTSDLEPYVSRTLTNIGAGGWVMSSPQWNGNTGAVTLISPTLIDNGTLRGSISASNAILGTTTGQNLGLQLRQDGRAGVGLLQFGGANSTDYVLNLSTYGGTGAFVALNPSVAATGVLGGLTSSNALLFQSGDAASGITQLSNGAVVLSAPLWSGGKGYTRILPFNTDFVTTMRGSLSSVSVSNSFIGSTTADKVGNGGITDLGSGNFLVSSSYNRSFIQWTGSGSTTDLGALTFMNASSPVVGALSSSNSLIGRSNSNAAGGVYALGNVTVLANGAYVVVARDVGMSNGTGFAVYGAAGSGVAGVAGPGTGSVGLYDTAQYSGLRTTVSGGPQVTDLGGGAWVGTVPWLYNTNYVADPYLVWGSSTNIPAGQVTTSNTFAMQNPGSANIGALGSGRFVAAIPNYGVNATEGAITIIDANSATIPTLSSSNALLGSAGDHLGEGMFALGNQRYALTNSQWNGNTGAVIVVDSSNAATRLQGSITTANAFVGSNTGDRVGSGGVSTVGNSNLSALLSSDWSSGKGAVTLFNTTSGDLLGTLGSSNSLVGRNVGDHVGVANYNSGGSSTTDLFTSLGSGLYAMRTAGWLANASDSSAAGAITWIDSAASALTGVVSASNSLVGAQAGDTIGNNATAPLLTSLGSNRLLLTNGNFNSNHGAVTLLNTSAHNNLPVGVVSSGNSLVNASATTGIFNTANVSLTSLTGGYALMTPEWDTGKGAVTWIPTGAPSLTGNISSSTSLVGTTAGQKLGGTAKLLASGPLLLGSPGWNSNRGAATLLTNASGLATTLRGTLSVDGSNSFVGNDVGDRLSSGGFSDLGNDIFVVNSPDVGSGAASRTVFGAATLGDSVTNALKGDINATNSFFSMVQGQPAAPYISAQGLTGAILSTGSEVGIVSVVQPVSLVNGGLTYSDYPNRNSNMRPMTIEAVLNTGTDLTLQATDAINVLSPIAVNNASGNGGHLTLQTNNANGAGIKIGSAGAITTDNGELTLISASNFVNNSTSVSSPFNTGTNRWTVYANDPATSSVGNNLGFDFKEYGKTFGQTLDGRTALGANTKAVVFATAPTLNVAAPSDSKIYDGTTALGTPYGISGLVGGDTVDVTAAYTSPHSGWDPANFQTNPSDIVVTIGAGGVKSSVATGSKPIYGYVNQNLVVPGPTTFTGAGTIDPFRFDADVDQNVIVTKVYDGTDAAPVGYVPSITNITPRNFNSNAPIPETFTISIDPNSGQTAYFLDGNTYSNTSNVATATNLQLPGWGGAYVLSNFSGGGQATDYDFSGFNNFFSAPAQITPKPLTGGVSVSNKVYDGTTTATVGGSLNSSLSGVVTGAYNFSGGSSPDDVQISGSGTAGAANFTDANAGSGKTVTVNVSGLTLTGNDASNYTVGFATATADITPKALTVTGSAVTSKQYDGNTSAAINVGTLSGFVGSETVSATGAGIFANANVANGINVATTYTLANGTNGGLASNYSLAPETLTGNITPAWLALIVGNLTGSINKLYDGTTNATLSSGNFQLTGWVNGDGTDVTVTKTSGTYADKDAGTGKLVTVSLSSGDFAATTTTLSNYGLPTTASGNIGEITAKSLTASYTGSNKVYDRLTTATVTGASTDVISGDTVTFSQSANFTDRNVGTGKTINVTGISIGGAQAGNYSLQNSTASTTADITAKALTAGYTGSNKVYDRLTTATVTGASADIINGDTITFSQSAVFADRNVGMGKTVNVSSIVLGGVDAGNYSLQNTTATATADITAKSLSVSYAGTNRVYDGSTAATVTDTINGVVSGDTVSVSEAAAFADRNAGTGKAINVTGMALGGADAGNYALASSTTSTTADITAKALTASYTGNSKVYDATTSATVTGTSADIVGGDTVTFSESAAFATKSAGTGKTINVTGISLAGAQAGNYSLQSTTASTTANITQASLSVSGATAANKVYDGNASATVSGGSVTALGLDNVTLSAANATFASKTAATGKAVTTAYTLSGSDAANYVLIQANGLTADITPKTVTATYTGVNKVYDSTTAAAVNGTLTGGINGDTISFSEAAAFADQNVGTAKVVSISGIALGGADAGNYALQNTSTSTTANITPFALSISGITANSKVYDGLTAASLSGSASLNGVFGGDIVSVSGSASGAFADKNVGTGKSILVSGLSLSGAQATNYTVGALSATADITAKALTATYTGTNKVYDRQTTATVTGASSDIVSGDAVTFSQSAAFSDRNAANGKTISVSSIALGGADAGNYSLQNTTATTSANITAKALTVAYTGTNKVYDANTSATVAGASTDIISGDTVTFSQTAAFATKVAGTGKTINVSGISLAGGDAGNYSLQNTSTTATANIAQANLTVTGASAANKVYDATTAATVTGGSVTALGPDAVTLSAANATFSDKNAGATKAVTTAYTLSGADAANYTLTQATGLTADITQANLVVTGASAANKVYDSTTAATVSGGSVSRLGLDDIALSAANATFATKTVGTGKAVTTAYILSGTDAGNYVLAQATGLSADITPATLAVNGASAANKVYDATAAASVSGGSVTALGVDSVTLSAANANFADQNVGTSKAVTTAYTLTGNDAANYVLAQAAGLSANITPAPLSVTGASAANKVYDGTSAATVTGGSVTALGADVITLSAANASFADQNAGTAKAVTTAFTLTGAAATNYALSQPSLSADITPRQLSVAGVAASDRTYDGTTSVTVTNWGNVNTGVGAETLVLNHGGASFSDANAGTGKTVTATGYSIANGNGGGLASNYQLTSSSATTTASIARAALTMTAQSAAKAFSDTDPTLGAVYSGFVGSETSSVLSGISITRAAGESAGNYVITPTATAGNYTITPVTGTFTVAPADQLVVQLGNVSMVYGSTPTLAVTSAKYYSASGSALRTLGITSNNGVFTVDDGLGTTASFSLAATGPGSSTSGFYRAGNHTITGSGFQVVSGSNFSNSQFSTGSMSVSRLAVDLTDSAGTGRLDAGTSVVRREYDGTTTAVIQNLANIDNLKTGDVVAIDTANAIGGFADSHAGNGKLATFTGVTLAGADANNYSFGGTLLAEGKVDTRTLTWNNIQVANRTYDTTTNATVTGVGGLGNIVGIDQVSIDPASVAGAFASKNAGTNVTVNVWGNITGANSSDYQLPGGTAFADITPMSLTVTGATSSSKAYDGTTTATVSGGNVSALSGDTINLSAANASFADKNAGTAKVVTTAYTLSGADAGNYSLVQVSGLTADIAAKALTASYSGTNRVYDATINASVIGSSSDVISGDTVTFSQSASFANKNAGTAKTVNISGIALGGSDAANYILQNNTATTTADISAKALTASYTATSKVYDATTSASVTGSSVDVISGDTVTFNQNSAFSDKNAGTSKTVNVTSIALAGSDAGNYSLQTTSASTTANITTATLTVTGASASNKVYDATTSATVTGASVAALSGDSVSLSAANASFANRNVGTGKAVTTAYTLSGTDAGNYSVQQVSGLVADISAKTLTANYTGNNRVYDATTSATVTGASTDIISGDTVTFSQSATFVDKNAGSAKTVNVTSIALGGADAGNYSLQNTTASTTATITSKALTASYTGAGKVYDATNNATVTGASTDIISGDTVTFSQSATFVDKNAGSAKTVNVTSIALTGTEAGNYSLQNTTASTTATITAKALTASYTGTSKVYDGTTSATVTGASADIISGDTVTFSQSAAFQTPAVGVAKTIDVTSIALSGTDGANYALTQTTATTFADIQSPPASSSGSTSSAVQTGIAGLLASSVQTASAPGSSVGVTQGPGTSATTNVFVNAITSGTPPASLITGGGVQGAAQLQTAVPAAAATVAMGNAIAGANPPPVQMVAGLNQAPVPLQLQTGTSGFVSVLPLGVVPVAAGMAANIALPGDTFRHTDQAGGFRLEARLEDGSPLPKWVQFDTNTGSFSLVPPQGESGEFKVVVSATDSRGRSASTLIRLVVGK